MTAPYYQDESVTVYAGDCLDVLRDMADVSVDSVVTDPPYGLEFMGKAWDSFGRDAGNGYRETPRINDRSGEGFPGHRTTAVNSFQAGRPFQQWCQLWATECLRVLKPGGHLLAFGGTRTWHRLACAIEDAGFEMRDSIAWLYGSGFPKSLDVSKAIDKAAGATRDVVGERVRLGDSKSYAYNPTSNIYGADNATDTSFRPPITAPATDDARTWQGWGTAMKPSFEPVVVARKPLIGTVAQNVLTHGTGALNIDGCRVGISDVDRAVVDRRSGAGFGTIQCAHAGREVGQRFTSDPAGRWPPNVVLDQDSAAELDRQGGGRSFNPAGKFGENQRDDNNNGIYGGGKGITQAGLQVFGYGDEGGPSRFFPVFRYEAKAPTSERPRVDGQGHATVKPLDLMRWLVRLVTPPGGLVLDLFAGSGTTSEACIIEGFRCILIEREPDYLPLIVARLSKPIAPVLFGESA